MTRAEAQALFRSFDDPSRGEAPLDFDREESVARFKQFVSALDEKTGRQHRTETDASIQDASFHASVFLEGGELRFSSFGRMVSLHEDHQASAELLVVVRELCDELEFRFIPPEYAALPYEGCNPGVSGFRDWWLRYFDYL